jgi:hypothetical protein
MSTASSVEIAIQIRRVRTALPSVLKLNENMSALDQQSSF